MNDNYFDYLLPVKESDESIKIPLPSIVESLLSLAFILSDVKPDERELEIFNRLTTDFNFDIQLKYKDNLDKLYSKTFTLVLKRPTWEVNTKYNGKFYTLRIERKT